MHLAGFRRITAAAVALAPSLALAHPGHDGDHDIVWDFSTGFGHPFGGWDHVLAMIAVGLWAAQLGGRARWLIPTTFVGTMAATSVLGQSSLMVPAVEQAIAASVLLLGLLVATMVRLPLAVGTAFIALFASFHGLAHGAELPFATNGLTYGAGFVVATSLLHASGFGIGFLFASHEAKRWTQLAGWLIAGSGLALLAG